MTSELVIYIYIYIFFCFFLLRTFLSYFSIQIQARRGVLYCKRAKSFQSCPTLWDPKDYSPPGSSIHGILWARILEGLPFPPPGHLPDPGIKLAILNPLKTFNQQVEFYSQIKSLHKEETQLSTAKHHRGWCSLHGELRLGSGEGIGTRAFEAGLSGDQRTSGNSRSELPPLS